MCNNRPAAGAVAAATIAQYLGCDTMHMYSANVTYNHYSITNTCKQHTPVHFSAICLGTSLVLRFIFSRIVFRWIECVGCAGAARTISLARESRDFGRRDVIRGRDEPFTTKVV